MTSTTNSQRPKLLFWILMAVVIPGILWSVICTVDLILHPFAPSPFFGSGLLRLVVGLVIAPLTMLVALLVIRREPRNVVGILLLLIGESYCGGAMRSDIQSPLAATLTSIVGSMEWPGLFLLILYFPDGQFFFRKIARLVNMSACFFCVMFLSTALTTPEITMMPAIEGFKQVAYPNPLYIALIAPITNALLPIGQALIYVWIVLGLVSLIFRYRVGDERKRLQIRWLGWSFGVFAVMTVVGIPFNLFSLSATSSFPLIYNLIFYTWLFLFPVIAVGNAILRHNLYDIDIIIRRTLIYSVLTAILALIYFGGVVLAQATLRPVIGENSDAGIVISTLVIAALFTPLRRRIQNIIDRRFYRRKYDAERTLAAFNATMRDEVDLDKLQAALVNVVQETMQPKVVGLWIKMEGKTKYEQ